MGKPSPFPKRSRPRNNFHLSNSHFPLCSRFYFYLFLLYITVGSHDNGKLALNIDSNQHTRLLDAKRRVKWNCVRLPRNCCPFLRRALHHCRLNKKKSLTRGLEVDAFIGKLKFLLRNTFYRNNEHSSTNWWYFELATCVRFNWL